MKRYIKSATKKVYNQRKYGRGGVVVEYTSGQEIYDMLKEADLLSYNEDLEPNSTVYHRDVEFISGPAEIEVVNGNNPYASSRTFNVIRDGNVVYTCRLFDFRKRVPALEEIASAGPTKFKKVANVEYQEQQARKQRIAENKSGTTEELFYDIYTNGIDKSVGVKALSELRYYANDEDWLNVGDWSLKLISEETEDWASIYVQAYGTTTKYVVELDTGLNTYQTTVTDRQGWHTE